MYESLEKQDNQTSEIGTVRERDGVRKDMEEAKLWKEQWGLDINNEWTQRYPYIYNERKPHYVNWETQLLFKHDENDQYFVVPKKSFTGSLQFCDNKCKEIKFK